MKNLKWIINLFFSLFLFVSYGQEGSLDTTFGDNGILLFSLSDIETRGRKILVLEDNSILIGNSAVSNSNDPVGFYLYKFLENGEVDISFGQNGLIFIPNGENGHSGFVSMVKYNDDKVLIRGTINGESKLIRIYQNGDFDLTYGENGLVSIVGGKIALQSNNKVIVASQFFDGYNNLYKFLRYDTNGSLDLSFGNDGVIITDITGYRFDLHSAIKIQNDDRIIVVGRSYEYGDDYHPVITRFTENGFLDTTFGNNGTVISTFSTESELGEFNDIGLFNEQIIVGGNYHYSNGTGGFGGLKPAVISFDFDGTYDNTFGNQGRIILETLHNANDRLWSMRLQSNGKILIGGGASYPFPMEGTDFFVTKLNDNGELDLNFGNNGTFLTSFNNAESNIVTDLELQENGEVLALGFIKEGFGDLRDAIICRLNNEILNTSNIEYYSRVSFYPNPVQDILRIENTSSTEITSIKIYDVLGRFVLSEEGDLNNINVSQLESGVLFIEVEIDEGSITKKIIKE